MRDRDPIEDAMLDRRQFERTVHDLEKFNEEIERYHNNIDKNSVEVMAEFMGVVNKTVDLRKKAERLEEEISKL